MLPDYPERLAGLYSEELEGLDEVIYVRPEDGGSFSLNLTAASVLEMCDGQHSRDEIARQLAGALPSGITPAMEQISADVDAILSSFVEHGLIHAGSQAGG